MLEKKLSDYDFATEPNLTFVRMYLIPPAIAKNGRTIGKTAVSELRTADVAAAATSPKTLNGFVVFIMD